jgi:hypothetical protein
MGVNEAAKLINKRIERIAQDVKDGTVIERIGLSVIAELGALRDELFENAEAAIHGRCPICGDLTTECAELRKHFGDRACRIVARARTETDA